MAKTFTKLGREIAIAVKEGGPHPESNSRLRVIIQNAKSANMPKDNVERAIKRATSKEQEDYKEMVYEGYGPYGIAIVVECATDNINRTVANVRSYFTRSGGNLGTTGSLDFLFERKCVFKIEANSFDVEELEFELIDHGAEEVFAEGDHIMIYGSPSDFGTIQKALEEKGCAIIQSGFERIPMDTKTVPAEAEEEIEKLLGKFEEDDDVQNIYHNMG